MRQGWGWWGRSSMKHQMPGTSRKIWGNFKPRLERGEEMFMEFSIRPAGKGLEHQLLKVLFMGRKSVAHGFIAPENAVPLRNLRVTLGFPPADCGSKSDSAITSPQVT